MKYSIVIMSLIVILVGGGVFGGLRLFDMSRQIDELNANYATLQTSFNNLQYGYNQLDMVYQELTNNYNLLDANHKALQSNYDSLYTDFQSLSADYDTLTLDYDALESKHDKLSGEVSSLKTQNSKLEREKRALQDLLDEYEKVPHAYYSTNLFKTYSNTYSDLSQFLNSEFELPSSYEEEVFDCSESAAYLEWALENAGFDAEIVVGPFPQDPTSGYHAWVIVYTTDDKVAVEATGFNKNRNAYRSWGRVPGVVYSDDTLIEGSEAYYNGYTNSFENIYEAIIREYPVSCQQWNWWVGAFGFE